MSISDINSTAYTEYINSTTSSKTSASETLGKDAFLKILVAQMQNQDPLNPMEDQDYIAQLAQFNSVEQMINLNDSTSASQGFNLVGKTVVAEVSNNNYVTGKVSSVISDSGTITLNVNGTYVPLANVKEVIADTEQTENE